MQANIEAAGQITRPSSPPNVAFQQICTLQRWEITEISKQRPCGQKEISYE